MAKRKRTVGLVTFLKGSSNPEERMPGCANFDHQHGGCLFELNNTCLVQEGQRCAYFERAVLPTAADIGLKELVYSLYAKQIGIELDCELISSDIRKCPDCGAELRKRQRYCDECSRKRRMEAQRKKRCRKKQEPPEPEDTVN